MPNPDARAPLAAMPDAGYVYRTSWPVATGDIDDQLHLRLDGVARYVHGADIADVFLVAARSETGLVQLLVPRLVEGVEVRTVVGLDLSRRLGEVSFDGIVVAASAVVGSPGAQGEEILARGLQLASVLQAAEAVGASEFLFQATVQYAKDRKAFGQPIGSFQHNRFLLAEMDTELEIGEQYIDRCLQAVVDGELTAVEASKAKWWCTETAKKVIDGCVQLHGGYGYMTEYRVARDYMDNRIMTIFGGTTEIMKDIIGRDLGL